ncbi:hypothetical protein [Shimia sp.]|uniref:hypothetical protein n=1 Tax=Shimia sp. TaxID=1954381 RepID=UPI0032997AAB
MDHPAKVPGLRAGSPCFADFHRCENVETEFSTAARTSKLSFLRFCETKTGDDFPSFSVIQKAKNPAQGQVSLVA